MANARPRAASLRSFVVAFTASSFPEESLLKVNLKNCYLKLP